MYVCMVTLDEDDSSGAYYIILAAGMTRISFNVSSIFTGMKLYSVIHA